MIPQVEIKRFKCSVEIDGKKIKGTDISNLTLIMSDTRESAEELKELIDSGVIG